VPVDQRLLVELVLQPDPEALAGLRDQAMTAVGLRQAEDGGRTTVDVDDPGADANVVPGGARAVRLKSAAKDRAECACGGGGCQKLAT
jgi:hypothetical protein